MKKLFLKVHLWLAYPTGILFSLICLTGTILVFETEIREALNNSRYFVKETKETPLSLDLLATKINEQLPDTLSISGIQTYSDPERTCLISLSGENKSRLSAFANPYTGEIVAYYNARENFFAKVRQLHRWLMFKGDGWKVGRNIVGVATLISVIVLISGIIVWIPKSRKQLKKRLRIRIGKGWRKFWYDLHLAGGIYTAIVVLVLALTGLTWSFEWYKNGFYKLFGVEMNSQGGGHGKGSDKGKGGSENEEEKKKTDFVQWQKALTKIQNTNTEYKYISIQDGSATLASNSSTGNSRALDRYTFDKETGSITKFNPYRNQEKAMKMRGWIYSVHVGSWGGIFTKILTFVASLVAGLLPISGYYMYYKKKRKKKGKKKKS